MEPAGIRLTPDPTPADTRQSSIIPTRRLVSRRRSDRLAYPSPGPARDCSKPRNPVQSCLERPPRRKSRRARRSTGTSRGIHPAYRRHHTGAYGRTDSDWRHRRLRAGVSLALRDQCRAVRCGDKTEDSDRTAVAPDAVTRRARRRSHSPPCGWTCRVSWQSVQELLRDAAWNRVRADARLAVRRNVRGLSIYSVRVCAKCVEDRGRGLCRK